MPILRACDALPLRVQRVLVGGTSGAGKSTTARSIGEALGLPYTEIDALHHGPDWTVRPDFLTDVTALSERPRWVTEYQYSAARPVLLARADLVVYLLLPRRVVMSRVTRRTVRRAWRREVLWNGNVEPPLRRILVDRENMIRWAWRTHSDGPRYVREIAETCPGVPLVVLRSRREVARWLRGPLARLETTTTSPRRDS